MKPPRLACFILLAAFIASAPSCSYAAVESGKNLAKFAKDPDPWMHIAADTEQRQPVYIGSTPREIALGIPPADGGRAILYESLRAAGEAQAREVREGLVRSGSVPKGGAVEFEAWPVRDGRGRLTWAFARWREGKGKPWQRISDSILSGSGKEAGSSARPVLPVTLNPANKADFSRIFDDVLALKSLYDRPVFGDCLWMTSDGIVLEAWMAPEQREAFGREVSEDIKKMGSSLLCRVMPQPARLCGKPVTFIIAAGAVGVTWPDGMAWKKEPVPLAQPSGSNPVIRDWPGDIAGGYKEDALIFSGAAPPGKDRAVFKRKNNVQKDNQLQDVADYLAARYQELGIKTWRQEFMWRGMKHSNLIAVIRGADASLEPVVLASHADSAFSDGIFAKTGERVSSSGAEGGSSGTAALVRFASVLRDAKPARDIWLVHLTGSEPPGDSLGARRFIGAMLAQKGDFEGVVMTGPIGARGKQRRAVRIDAGEAPGSQRLAQTAVAAAKSLGLEPSVNARFDVGNVLYAGDGLIFSEAGFPVVSIGPARDPDGAAGRGGPPETPDDIDWDYAVLAARAVVETVARIAAQGLSTAPSVVRQAQPAKLRAAATVPDWSIAVYSAADEADLARAYNPRLKDLVDAPVPENVEVLIERDADWPDGTARIVRRSASHEEMELPERDSASTAAFGDFLKWAASRAKGKKRLLIVQGSSFGWRGIVRDNTVPARGGTSSVMPLADLARAVRESAFRPDVALFDASATGTAEVVEDLRDVAPYIIVSQLDVPSNGYPAAKLFEMASKGSSTRDAAPVTAAELASRLPEDYVREYARDGSMAEVENRYRVVTMSAVFGARWEAFTEKFKELVVALEKAGFRNKAAASPEWAAAISDRNNNADIVELLNRLPLLVEDPAVIAAAAQALDVIGYPGDVAAENSSYVTLDPAETRSFELRIETCPYLQKDRALGEMKAAWQGLNQDLQLPAALAFDISDFWEDKRPRREFIVRCPDGVMKSPVRFRPWAAGAKYCLLKTVDRSGRAAEKRYIKGVDYISVTDFPESSFMAAEAHSQGAPFIHGIGIAMGPSQKPGAESIPAPGGPEAYRATAWNKKTGWADLIAGAGPAAVSDGGKR